MNSARVPVSMRSMVSPEGAARCVKQYTGFLDAFSALNSALDSEGPQLGARPSKIRLLIHDDRMPSRLGDGLSSGPRTLLRSLWWVSTNEQQDLCDARPCLPARDTADSASFCGILMPENWLAVCPDVHHAPASSQAASPNHSSHLKPPSIRRCLHSPNKFDNQAAQVLWPVSSPGQNLAPSSRCIRRQNPVGRRW